MKILINLDALADSSHRHGLRNESFDDFYAAQVDDEPNQIFVRMLEQLGEAYELIVYTTMSEDYRLQVESWLMEHNILADDVLMRQQGDYSKNYQCALDMINGISNIEFVIENDIRVIEELRGDGHFVIEAS